MNPVAGEGHITAASYFAGLDTDANKAFVKLYKKKFGADQSTNTCAETAYFQVYLFARALAQADSTDSDDLRPFVLGSSFDAPQGRVEIDAESGHAKVWTRIGRANRLGQFDLIWESGAPVEPDPFLICSSSRRGARRAGQQTAEPAIQRRDDARRGETCRRLGAPPHQERDVASSWTRVQSPLDKAILPVTNFVGEPRTRV